MSGGLAGQRGNDRDVKEATTRYVTPRTAPVGQNSRTKTRARKASRCVGGDGLDDDCVRLEMEVFRETTA